MNSIGNAIVVWHHDEGGRGDIWSNRFNVADGTWSIAELVESNDIANALMSPQVALDDYNNAIAVWVQQETYYDLVVSRFDAVSGMWSEVELLEQSNHNAWAPHLAMSPGGNAVAVWMQQDGYRYNIWSNRFDVTAGSWSTADLIETNDSGTASSPQVAMSSSDNAIAVWMQHDGTTYNICSNHFIAESLP